MNVNSIGKRENLHLSFAALLLIFMGYSFRPILQELVRVWDSGDNNYCFLVVPLFLYLCWEKRETFRFTQFSWNAWGVFSITIAVLLIIAGQLGSVITLYFIGIWASIFSIAYTVYGSRIKQLAFPFFILLFIIPIPPYINNILTFQLKLAASSLATLMLRLSGVSVFLDGNIIDLGITQLEVVEACSGLRYLMPLFLLALLIGYFFTKGWWRNGVLVLLVIPLSVFFNSLRIWMSGILTVKGHPELVENFFHDFSGWVIFMIAGAILFGVTRILNKIVLGNKDYGSGERGGIKDQDRIKDEGVRIKEGEVQSERNTLEVGGLKLEATRNSQLATRSPQTQQHETRNTEHETLSTDPATRNSQLATGSPYTRNPEPGTRNLQIGIAKPIAITVIACLLFVGSGYALKKIPSATNMPERQSFKSFPIDIGQWEGRRSYISQEILDQLWSDDYVQASFVKPGTRNAIHLLIPFYEWQGTRHTIHAPQSCLLGGGWALTGSQERLATMGDGRKIPVMTLKLEKGNAKILGSYFFFQRGRVLTNVWMNKAYLMYDAFTKRRTDGALVRVELVMAPGQSVDDAWEKLEEFITELWPILPRYIPE